MQPWTSCSRPPATLPLPPDCGPHPNRPAPAAAPTWRQPDGSHAGGSIQQNHRRVKVGGSRVEGVGEGDCQRSSKLISGGLSTQLITTDADLQGGWDQTLCEWTVEVPSCQTAAVGTLQPNFRSTAMPARQRSSTTITTSSDSKASSSSTCGFVLSHLLSFLSLKQCAAVRTRRGAINVPCRTGEGAT